MERFEERDSIVLEKEDQKIFAIHHRPLGVQKAPCVLICHGLAGHKIGHHRLYVLLSECLSKHGVGSLRLDFRGSGDSEGTFEEMTIDTEVGDALTGLNWMKNNPMIDSSRIGIFGRSFGGAVALLAADQFKEVKSLALWSPIFNASQWEEQWELVESGVADKAKRIELMRINGQLPSMNFYKQLFSLDLSQVIKRLNHLPLLHIHGIKDPIVNISHADLYVKSREDSQVHSKFIRLLHSDHDFTHPEEKAMAIEETCVWFQKTL
jgi:alpha/beta superfamily hydrolase